MSRLRSVVLLTLVLVGAVALAPGRAAPVAVTAVESPPTALRVEHVEFDSVVFDVAAFPWGAARLQLLWRDADGGAFGSVEQVQKATGGSLAFLTNAGIFEPDQVPTGLWVQAGATLHALNTADGEGNFFLKPNGVFFATDAGPAILETGVFAAANRAVSQATQSGPLLLQHGQLHPSLRAGSSNRQIRGAVGVAGQVVYVVVSEQPVNLETLARLFRDRLGCADALYLDGVITQLYAPSLGRTKFNPRAFGGLVTITAP